LNDLIHLRIVIL